MAGVFVCVVQSMEGGAHAFDDDVLVAPLPRRAMACTATGRQTYRRAVECETHARVGVYNYT